MQTNSPTIDTNDVLEGSDEDDFEKMVDDDGFEFDDYLDDSSTEDEEDQLGLLHRMDPESNILRGIGRQFQAIFPNSVKASQCNETHISFNKCDVDSISLTSTSLLKVVHRLGKKGSVFVTPTKADAGNVDSGSRSYIGIVNDMDEKTNNFNPRNRSNTGFHKTIRLCKFKNIHLGDCTINSGEFTCLQ
jgi:hypothetical protein